MTCKTKQVIQREKSEMRPELLLCIRVHMNKGRPNVMRSAHSLRWIEKDHQASSPTITFRLGVVSVFVEGTRVEMGEGGTEMLPEKDLAQFLAGESEKWSQETVNIEKYIGIPEEKKLVRRIPKSVYSYLWPTNMHVYNQCKEAQLRKNYQNKPQNCCLLNNAF